MDSEQILVDTEDQLHQLIADITITRSCAIDTETTGLLWALGDKAFMATFAPTAERGYAIMGLDHDEWGQHCTNRVLKMMENSNFTFIFHNAIFDLHMLRAWCGWYPANGYSSLRLEDTMYGFRTLFPGQPAKLKIAAKRYCGDIDVDTPQKRVQDWLAAHTTVERVAGKAVTNAPGWDKVPQDIMLPYAVQDATMTRICADALLPAIENTTRPERLRTGKRIIPELYETYRREVDILPIVADMERVGFPVNRAKLMTMIARATQMVNDLNAKWHEMGYGDTNPGSNAQLAKLMYGVLGEKVIHLTKAEKPSTGEFALRDMKNREVGDILILMRGWKKHLEKMQEILHYLADDDCVHSSFKPDGARTGRFSSADPALQNTFRPDFEVEYTMIRDIFEPPAGFEFLFVDFSQIELRLAAEYMHDEDMKNSFINGVDFHSLTAARTYGIDISEVTKPQRDLSKILNFSILYGAGKRRVTSALRYGAASSKPLTREQAKAALRQFQGNPHSMKHTRTVQDADGIRTEDMFEEFIETADDADLFGQLAEDLLAAYHAENPLVRTFTNKAGEAAKANGHIVTAFGFTVPVNKDKSYMAGNGIIQGSAAGLLKETMIRIERVCRQFCLDRGLTMWQDVRLITTIHDEVGMMLPTGMWKDLARAIYPHVTNWPQFEVKIDVEFAYVPEGSSWARKIGVKNSELFDDATYEQEPVSA